MSPERARPAQLLQASPFRSTGDRESLDIVHRFFAPTDQTNTVDGETFEQSLHSFAPDWQQFVWVYDITPPMLEWRHIKGVTFAPAQALIDRCVYDDWRTVKFPI